MQKQHLIMVLFGKNLVSNINPKAPYLMPGQISTILLLILVGHLKKIIYLLHPFFIFCSRPPEVIITASHMHMT